MASDLHGRWVAITGASSGIGAAAALEFARCGAPLLLGARRIGRLRKIAAAARAAGAPTAAVRRLDVADPRSVAAFVAWVRRVAGRVDIVVNNAGGAHGLDPVAEGREEDWRTMVEVNLLGVARMTRALLPLMPSNAGAYVINVGSVAGRDAYAGGAVYCAVKAAVRSLTRALRLELLDRGIRVGCVQPGMTDTEFSAVRFKGDRERARKVYEGMTPLTAQDVAGAIVWLATRPPRVCVDEITLLPTDQADVHHVRRK